MNKKRITEDIDLDSLNECFAWKIHSLMTQKSQKIF